MTIILPHFGWWLGLALISVLLVLFAIGLLFEALFYGMGDALSARGALVCAAIGLALLAAVWWLWARWWPLCQVICI